MDAITKQVGRFSETAIDGEIVIMRLDNGELLSLSGTAAATWRLIDGKRDHAALLAALADDFSTEEESIAPDVDELLERLRETGLLAGG